MKTPIPQPNDSRVIAMSERLRANGIRSSVIKAMERVPRDKFVKGLPTFAYSESAHPVSEGQLLYSPSQCALLLNQAPLKQGQKVLQLGVRTGGYITALLAEMVGPNGQVHVVERNNVRLSNAASTLYNLYYDVSMNNIVSAKNNGSGASIQLHYASGLTAGLPNEAPYDAIISTVALSEMPIALGGQLAASGHLAVPIYSLTILSESQMLQTVATPNGLLKVTALPLSSEYFLHSDYEMQIPTPKFNSPRPDVYVETEERRASNPFSGLISDPTPRKVVWREFGGN